MQTKSEYIESLIHRLAGGEPTADLRTRFHPAMVEKEIDKHYEPLLKSLISMGNKINYGLLDPYTKAYNNVSVTLDSSRDEYYADLPAPVVALPMNAGIRTVGPQVDPGTQFAPIGNNAEVVFRELEVGTVSSTPTYYVEQNRIWMQLYGFPVETVLIKMVPTFSALEEDDYVTMPEVMTRNGMVKVDDLVYQALVTMPPEEMSNNNNPKQV